MRRVRVKISSEAAGTIALTPVVVQEMPFDELLARIAAISGKDPRRIRDLLDSGTVVNGNSRLRWERLDFTHEEFAAALARLPDPDPARPFSRDACVQVVLRGGTGSITVTKEAGSKRRLFRRTSFWDTLLDEITDPEYVNYSYSDRADVYRCAATSAIDAASRIREMSVHEILLYCTR